MDKETEENAEGWGAPSRRLAVIRGHLSGSGPSAPMSSSKAEVQRAFPRSRYLLSGYIILIGPFDPVA